MGALEFALADLERELVTLSSFASKFFDPEGSTKLHQFRLRLAPLLASGRGAWVIPADDPIRTRRTNQYAGGHGDEVWAAISCIWELRRVQRTNLLTLDGIASTRVELFSKDDTDIEHSLGYWRMEIGDEDSPGCHFHAQVMGQSTSHPFPKWLSIPRLPALLLTPASTIEFALSELYQDQWALATSQLRGDLTIWRGLQEQRIRGWLSWQSRIIDATITGLPWTNLKRAKPDTELINDIRGSSPSRVTRRRGSR